MKMLQNLLVQGQGWARGYAAAAVVECIKVLSEVPATGNMNSSGGNSTTKDVAAILSTMFEVLIDDKVPCSLQPAVLRLLNLLHLSLSRLFLNTFQVSRSIGDERDCCSCVNFIMHSAAPLLLPAALEAHISALRIFISKGRDVQAVVAWQQLAVLTQSGRIPRSSCDWFIDAVAAAAAGPSTPALRMAFATALRAFIISHQLPPLPILSRFLSFTLVPEPAVNEVCRRSVALFHASNNICALISAPQTMETFAQLVRDVSITGLPGVQLPALAVMKSACFCIAAVLSAPTPQVSIPSRVIRHIVLCTAICFSHMDRDYAFPVRCPFVHCLAPQPSP